VSILTRKVKHGHDFTEQLIKARRVADFAIHNRKKLSSKYVKDLGLPSAISNQILKKYGKNKKVKKLRRCKLTVPGQAIKLAGDHRSLSIKCLDFTLDLTWLPWEFTKVNQVEIGPVFCSISVTVEDQREYEPVGFLGVDMNTSGHCVVAASPETNVVMKMGKKAKHVHLKYKQVRRHLRQEKAHKPLKRLKHRECNIVKDVNHKVSRELVDYAFDHKLGIKLEDLKGIRKQTKKRRKSDKDGIYTLNSWSYYQLNQMIVYKAKLRGVPVIIVPAAYTSQTCSRCFEIGIRKGKHFECPHCGHTSHADVNAAFNISRWEVWGKPGEITGMFFGIVAEKDDFFSQSSLESISRLVVPLSEPSAREAGHCLLAVGGIVTERTVGEGNFPNPYAGVHLRQDALRSGGETDPSEGITDIPRVAMLSTEQPRTTSGVQ